MRQVVNGAKGGPLLGHSSCIVQSSADQHVREVVYEEEFEDDEEEDTTTSAEPQVTPPSQRRRHPHSPKSK